MARLPEHLEVALSLGQILDAAGVSHMVTGSLASSIHGEPRSTYDVDVVLRVGAEDVDRVCAALRPEFDVDDVAMRYAVETGSSWNALHEASAIRIDLFVLKSRPFSQCEFERRQREELDPAEGRRLWVATPEDALLAKLEWYRKGGELSERQWADVLGLLRARGEDLDVAYVERWARELGIDDLWRRANRRD